VLTALVLGCIVIAPIAILRGVMRNRDTQRKARSATVDLTVDEFGVRRALADGREEGVDWTEIEEVEVYRTKSGPHGDAGGMVMLSGDEARGCLVPLDRLDTPGLIESLTRLPGFDMRLLQEALEAEPPRQLVVWHRGR
jgi:hypothetical protein